MPPLGSRQETVGAAQVSSLSLDEVRGATVVAKRSCSGSIKGQVRATFRRDGRLAGRRVVTVYSSEKDAVCTAERAEIRDRGEKL